MNYFIVTYDITDPDNANDMLQALNELRPGNAESAVMLCKSTYWINYLGNINQVYDYFNQFISKNDRLMIFETDYKLNNINKNDTITDEINPIIDVIMRGLVSEIL